MSESFTLPSIAAPASLLIEIVLVTISLLLLVPCTVIFVECILAVLPRQHRSPMKIARSKTAVLVPAHNEAAGIGATLNTVLPQLTPEDHLVVIADNCTDETALVARSLGATVIERQDSERKGKGFALDFGLQFIATDPPDVVVVVDADCAVEQGAIAEISRLAINTSRPVQAVYLLAQPSQPRPKDAVSALAFTVKNLVRPLGLNYLRLPCLLTGTGMAFPWQVLGKVSLASGDIVEDMKLALDLAIAGHPPIFCADARVTGALPQQAQATKSQRTRWEHGHLRTLLTQAPHLIQEAIRQKRVDLLAIALDLSVPPLSLLVILWGATALAAFLYWAFAGVQTAMILSAIEGLFIFVAVLAAWAKFAKDSLPLKTLLSVPFYILWKVPLYFAFLIKPQTKWVRTERDVPNPSSLK